MFPICVYIYIHHNSLDLLVSRKKSPINDSLQMLRFQAEENAAASGPFRHLDVRAGAMPTCQLLNVSPKFHGFFYDGNPKAE